MILFSQLHQCYSSDKPVCPVPLTGAPSAIRSRTAPYLLLWILICNLKFSYFLREFDLITSCSITLFPFLFFRIHLHFKYYSLFFPLCKQHNFHPFFHNWVPQTSNHSCCSDVGAAFLPQGRTVSQLNVTLRSKPREQSKRVISHSLYNIFGLHCSTALSYFAMCHCWFMLILFYIKQTLDSILKKQYLINCLFSSWPTFVQLTVFVKVEFWTFSYIAFPPPHKFSNWSSFELHSCPQLHLLLQSSPNRINWFANLVRVFYFISHVINENISLQMPTQYSCVLFPSVFHSLRKFSSGQISTDACRNDPRDSNQSFIKNIEGLTINKKM